MINEKKTFMEYISIIKKKTYIFSIITIFMFFIILYISIKFDNYVLFILEIIMLIKSTNKIKKYCNTRRIKTYLINNDLINTIGKIYLMVGNNCFLTEYYIIVLHKKEIVCFDYLEIRKVYKEYWNKFNLGAGKFGNHVELYLHFVLKNGIEFKILTDTFNNILLIIDENFQNIINYVLQRNPNIIVEDEILKNKLCMK